MAAFNSSEGFLIRIFSSLPSLLCPPFTNAMTRRHRRSVMHKIVEYGGGLWNMVVDYFRYTWQLCLISGSLGHLEITLSLVKNFLESWKNSGTFYRYFSCFVWSVSDGPQFGWTGCAFYGKLSSAAKWYCLYTICLYVFSLVLGRWCDGFTSKVYLRSMPNLCRTCAWTVINNDTKFLHSKTSARLCGTLK